MEWLKKLVSTRSGMAKILWTITFILLIMTFLTGLGQPILTSTLDKKLEEFSDGQKNKDVYDSWYEHQRNLAKLQGYDYKDPREVKKESLLWSWKWGIAFVIFFIASLIYTVFAGFGEAKNYIKKKIQERKQSGKKIGLAWTVFIILAAFLLGIASTLYGEYKIGGGILKEIQKLAADFFAVVRKTVKGVGL
jgi:hypothetical protein